MELVRELQTPTQKTTTTQEIYSQETEEEQSRDTDEGSAEAATTPAVYAGYKHPLGWEQWNMKRRNMYKKRQRDKQRKEGRGALGSLG